MPKSVELLTKANAELEKKVQKFTKQCAEKDNEIARLTELLQNQSPDAERQKILDQIALIDDELKVAELRNPVRQRDYKANLQFIDRKEKKERNWKRNCNGEVNVYL